MFVSYWEMMPTQDKVQLSTSGGQMTNLIAPNAQQSSSESPKANAGDHNRDGRRLVGTA